MFSPIVITHSSVTPKAPATDSPRAPFEPFVFEKKEVKPNEPKPKASALTELVDFTRRNNYVTYLR